MLHQVREVTKMDDGLRDASVEAVLVRLHAASHAEDESLAKYFEGRAGAINWERLDEGAHRLRIEAADGHRGVVIGTEYEPHKALAARANFSAAGLSASSSCARATCAKRCARSSDRWISCSWISGRWRGPRSD